MKTVWGCIILVMTAVVLSVVGCGGGGGSDRSVRGVANIHSDSYYPMVAFVRVSGTTFVNAAPGDAIARSTNGWQDVDFAAPLPSDKSRVYSVAAYNDLDRDGKYRTSELLGFCDDYLRWSTYAEKWQFISSSGYTTVYDALEGSGKYNCFIDCDYRRASSSTNEQREADQIAKMEKFQASP